MLLNFLYFVSVLLALGVMLRIFSQRSSRGSALAWLLLVILVPAAGALAYLLIGERRLGRTWMKRAIALQPQVLRWARAIPAANVVAPNTLSTGCAEHLSRLATGLGRSCR
jgi:uncharacterized membrane protein